jgi:hypothetical protein
MEGDIRLGFGAAKGYGAVHAEIRSIKLPHWNDCPDVFKEGVDADQWEKIGVESAPSAFLQDLMGYWLIGLEDQVQAGGGKR